LLQIDIKTDFGIVMWLTEKGIIIGPTVVLLLVKSHTDAYGQHPYIQSRTLGKFFACNPMLVVQHNGFSHNQKKCIDFGPYIRRTKLYETS